MVSGHRPQSSNGVVCYSAAYAWSQSESEVHGMCVTDSEKTLAYYDLLEDFTRITMYLRRNQQQKINVQRTN